MAAQNEKPRVIIVGAGISGLATAWRIRDRAGQHGPPVAVQVLEAAPVPGGKIETLREDGFVCEGGPNGFLDSRTPALDLCAELDLTPRLLRAAPTSKKRYVFARGKLLALPTNPIEFFASDLLSWRGKLRLVAELGVGRGESGGDESLAEFARRRLGSEALEMLIDPMVTGVYAGDPAQLSLRSAFPRIFELEQTYGGLIRALLAIQGVRLADRVRGRARAQSGGPAGPAGSLTSFPKGLVELISALSERLSGCVTTNTTVQEIRLEPQHSRSFVVQSESRSDRADVLVLATPAHAAARILGPLRIGVEGDLAAIPYAPTAVVALGFATEQLGRPLDGFGFVIPQSEKRQLLGTLWTSALFPGERSPEGLVLLRTMVGGVRNPALLPDNDDDSLIQLVLEELRVIMGVQGKPRFKHVFRYEQGIPQYTVGHSQRVANIDLRIGRIGGLFVTGNAYRGVSLAECAADSDRIANAVLEHLRIRS